MEEEKNKEVVEEQENDKTAEEETELDAHNEEEPEVEDTDFDDGEEQEPKKEVKKQNRKTNAQYAEERRRREQEIAKENFDKGMREALGDINTFTGEKIEDGYDLEVYKNMREAEKSGFDPISEYHLFIKQKTKKLNQEKLEQEQKEKAKKEEEQKEQEKTKEDAKEFMKVYPKVSIPNLMKDNDFLDYADGKLGNKPLKDIYANYLKRQDRIKKQEQEELNDAKKEVSKVGSQTKNEGSSSNSKKISEMTDEEYKEYWRKTYGTDFN